MADFFKNKVCSYWDHLTFLDVITWKWEWENEKGGEILQKANPDLQLGPIRDHSKDVGKSNRGSGEKSDHQGSDEGVEVGEEGGGK